MKALALLLAVGATACAASQPAATTPASAKHSPATQSDVGATNLQGQEDPKRALTSSECEELGGWITQVCHETTTRQARVEGWCSDMVARAATDGWKSECGKLSYMDFMCFRTVDTPQSMMTCDRSSER